MISIQHDFGEAERGKFFRELLKCDIALIEATR
jgi:hypothetical protein